MRYLQISFHYDGIVKTLFMCKVSVQTYRGFYDVIPYRGSNQKSTRNKT